MRKGFSIIWKSEYEYYIMALGAGSVSSRHTHQVEKVLSWDRLVPLVLVGFAGDVAMAAAGQSTLS
jgi:hypothetical protein